MNGVHSPSNAIRPIIFPPTRAYVNRRGSLHAAPCATVTLFKKWFQYFAYF